MQAHLKHEAAHVLPPALATILKGNRFVSDRLSRNGSAEAQSIAEQARITLDFFTRRYWDSGSQRDTSVRSGRCVRTYTCATVEPEPEEMHGANNLAS